MPTSLFDLLDGLLVVSTVEFLVRIDILYFPDSNKEIVAEHISTSFMYLFNVTFMFPIFGSFRSILPCLELYFHLSLKQLVDYWWYSFVCLFYS